MGIDPITHERLYKQAAVPREVPNITNDLQAHFVFGQLEKNKKFGHVTSSENSNSSHENYSSRESPLLNPNDDNDDPLSYILSDTFLNDSPWNFPAIGVEDSELGFSSSDDNFAWLLDYQDLGDEELMLGLFNDMDITTFEMGNRL